VLALLSAAGVPAGKIYTAADILQDPHYQARGMLCDVETRDGAKFKVPGIVPKLSGTPGRLGTLAPQLGEHTDDVLAGIGFSVAEIAELREQRIVA
jgi:formyl-CoA transferase